MDLSNLGIAYRALGRADIASGLFERAYKLMHAAVGPDDPKTKAIERNLDNPGGDKPTPASPQAIS